MILKTIKTISLVMIICVAFLSNSTYAKPQGGQRGGQQGPPPIPSAKQIKKMINELTTEISLSEPQELEVLELYTNHFKEIKDKIKSGRPDRDEMQSIRKNFEDDVKEVLSEDQQELYTRYLNNNRPKKGRREKRN